MDGGAGVRLSPLANRLSVASSRTPAPRPSRRPEVVVHPLPPALSDPTHHIPRVRGRPAAQLGVRGRAAADRLGVPHRHVGQGLHRGSPGRREAGRFRQLGGRHPQGGAGVVVGHLCGGKNVRACVRFFFLSVAVDPFVSHSSVCAFPSVAQWWWYKDRSQRPPQMTRSKAARASGLDMCGRARERRGEGAGRRASGERRGHARSLARHSSKCPPLPPARPAGGRPARHPLRAASCRPPLPRPAPPPAAGPAGPAAPRPSRPPPRRRRRTSTPRSPTSSRGRPSGRACTCMGWWCLPASPAPVEGQVRKGGGVEGARGERGRGSGARE